MNVAMTFVSLALIGELMVMMIYPPPFILIPIIPLSYHHDPILIRESGDGELMVMIYPPPIILIPITSPSYHHDPILIRESGAKGADGLRTQSHVVHDNSSPRQPPYFCESR